MALVAIFDTNHTIRTSHERSGEISDDDSFEQSAKICVVCVFIGKHVYDGSGECIVADESFSVSGVAVLS